MSNEKDSKLSSKTLNKIYAYTIGFIFIILFIKLFIFYFKFVPDHIEYLNGFLNVEYLDVVSNAMNKIILDVGAIVFVLLLINVMLIRRLFR